MIMMIQARVQMELRQQIMGCVLGAVVTALEREVMFVCWCSTIITGALGEPIKTLVRAVATSRHVKEKTIVCNLETSKGTTVGNLNNLETLDSKCKFSLTLTITCIG